MATTVPGQNGHVDVADHPLQEIAELSLSTKTIHADDFLNKGQDVAPPLHVSTTFRYNRDPSKLKTWKEHEVSCNHSMKYIDQLTEPIHRQRRLMTHTYTHDIPPQTPHALKPSSLLL